MSQLDYIRPWVHHHFGHNMYLFNILSKMTDPEEILSTALLYNIVVQHGMFEVINDIKNAKYETIHGAGYGHWVGRGIGEYSHYKITVQYDRMHLRYSDYKLYTITQCLPPDITAGVSFDIQYRHRGEFCNLLNLHIQELPLKHMPPVVQRYAINHLSAGNTPSFYNETNHISLHFIPIETDGVLNMLAFNDCQFNISMFDSYDTTIGWKVQKARYGSSILNEWFPGCSMQEICDRLPGLFSTEEERKQFIFESTVLGQSASNILFAAAFHGVAPVAERDILSYRSSALDFFMRVGFELRNKTW